MENQELLHALSLMMDEKLDQKLSQVIERLDRLENSMDELKEKVETIEEKVYHIEETQEILLTSQNRLIEWADECTCVLKFPLPKP